MNHQWILAIEAAIGGGSLAVLDDRRVLAAWESDSARSASEELLAEIDSLLKRSQISLDQLSMLAVSNGPGSYTGIRIGIATAMGLARALTVPLRGISLAKAIASGQSERSIVVLPIGRNGYHWNLSGSPSAGDIFGSGSSEELRTFLSASPNLPVLAHSAAVVACGEDRQIIDLGTSLAKFVGLAAIERDDGLVPEYARDRPIALPSKQ